MKFGQSDLSKWVGTGLQNNFMSALEDLLVPAGPEKTMHLPPPRSSVYCVYKELSVLLERNLRVRSCFVMIVLCLSQS